MNSKFFGNYFKKNFFNSKNFINFASNNNKIKSFVNLNNKFTITRMFYLNKLNNLIIFDISNGLLLSNQSEKTIKDDLEDTENKKVIGLENLNLILGKSLCVNNGKFFF